MSDLKQKVWEVMEFQAWFKAIYGELSEVEQYLKHTPEKSYDAAWENVMQGVDEEGLSQYLDALSKYEKLLGELFLQTNEFASELKDEYKFPEEQVTVQ